MSKKRGFQDRVKLEETFLKEPNRITFKNTPYSTDDELLQDLPPETFTELYLDGETTVMVKCNHEICSKKRFADQEKYEFFKNIIPFF